MLETFFASDHCISAPIYKMQSSVSVFFDIGLIVYLPDPYKPGGGHFQGFHKAAVAEREKAVKAQLPYLSQQAPKALI